MLRPLAAAFLAACAASGPPQDTTAPVHAPRLAPDLAALGARAAVGERVPLELAQLFVPEGFVVPEDGAVPLAVHFQGGVTIAEENFVRSGHGGVLIASTLSGRSSSFSRPYRDREAFAALLTRAAGHLSTPERAVRFEPITVTFFSAGYGAVRELLKDPEHFDRIDALVSADSIYADVVSDRVRAADAVQMVDFMRFAQAAARGEKTFVVAHGQTPTPYASTAECADLLLAAVAGQRLSAGRHTERGVPIAAEYHVQGFHLYTFAEGRGGDDEAKRIHMDCLYMIPELLRDHVVRR